MSLVTRCSSCATTFRVSPAQLSARGGRVRCGKCFAAFDGVANLLTEEAIAQLPQEPSPQLGLFDAHGRAVSPTPPAAADTVEAAQVTATMPLPDPDAAGPAADAGLGPAAPAAEHPEIAALKPVAISDEPKAVSKPAAAATATAPVGSRASRPSAIREPPAAAAATDAEAPAFLQSRARPAYTLVWTLLALIAMTALAAQAVLHMRTEIAVLMPEARIHLETACEMLGCELRLPRRAELMSIESSDLQADARRSGVIVLNALLRNRAPFEQEYPDLELTLTDERDQAVIRKVLQPADYLQDRRSGRLPGIGAGAEEAIRVHLDTSRIRATGYRLYLFYR